MLYCSKHSTLKATNNGAADAENVQVSDELPTGLSVSGPLPGGCSNPGNSATVTCELGTLAGNGGMNSATFTVLVDPSFAGSSIDNTGTVTTTTTESNSTCDLGTIIGNGGMNSATFTVLVDPSFAGSSIDNTGTVTTTTTESNSFVGQNVPVGGTDIPINTTSLLLAGAASVSMWMIPVVLAGAGIGAFVIIRRK
jgi:uncharacterized repeat protein (TIGR01451 family)